MVKLCYKLQMRIALLYKRFKQDIATQVKLSEESMMLTPVQEDQCRSGASVAPALSITGSH